MLAASNCEGAVGLKRLVMWQARMGGRIRLDVLGTFDMALGHRWRVDLVGHFDKRLSLLRSCHRLVAAGSVGHVQVRWRRSIRAEVCPSVLCCMP